MSDRPGSVRTGTRTGDDSATPENPASAEQPGGASVSSTQAIPTTGAVRAQKAGGPATGATAPGGGPSGPPSAAQPAVPAQAAAAAPARPAGTTAPAGQGATRVPAGPGTGTAAPAASGTAAGAPAAQRTAAQAGRPARGGGKAGRGPRRARLQLRNVDIWSAFKISLVLSIALFFVWMVAVGILYGVLAGLGVFATLNDLFGQLGSASSSGGGSEVITPGIVFGGAAVIGAINVVLMTALFTVGTFIYNLCADLVGGLEVTLSERD